MALSRIISDVILFIFLLFFPGVPFLAAGIISVIFFDNLSEFIIFSVLADIVYGVSVERMSGFRFIFTTISVVAASVVYLVKMKLRT